MTADPTPNPLDSEYLKRPDAQGHLKVLEVLRRWDPIGVVDIAPDEYDAYVPEIIRMLDAGVNSRKLHRWMLELAHDHMGLSYVDKRHTRRCADDLTSFWQSWRGS